MTDHAATREPEPGAHAAATAAPPLVLHDSPAPGVALVTLNRARSRNALSLAMMRALIETLGRIGADPSVKAIVLTGDGPAFCAGHDLKELRGRHDGREPDAALLTEIFQTCSTLMLTITRAPQPVIAAVNGIATAAGCQLAATTDLAIAGQSSRFATPGVNIGLFCSTPMVALTRAVGRKAAMEMLLLGDMVDAETARTLGLVNRVVADDAVLDTALDWAGRIAGKSPTTVAIGKRAFYDQAPLDLEAAYRHTADVMVGNMGIPDAAEGIDAFLDKRAPQWRETRDD